MPLRPHVRIRWCLDNQLHSDPSPIGILFPLVHDDQDRRILLERDEELDGSVEMNWVTTRTDGDEIDEWAEFDDGVDGEIDGTERRIWTLDDLLVLSEYDDDGRVPVEASGPASSGARSRSIVRRRGRRRTIRPMRPPLRPPRARASERPGLEDEMRRREIPAFLTVNPRDTSNHRDENDSYRHRHGL